MTGLIGWWPLNEDSGTTAYDLSGNGNHGTLNGGIVQGVAGKGGLTSYSFDGSSGYVNTNKSFSSNIGDGSHSVSAWVKARSTPSNDYIYGERGSSTWTEWWYDSGGSFKVRTGSNNTILSTDSWPDPTSGWVHVTHTVDRKSDASKLYMNGNKMDENSSTRSLGTTSDTLKLGQTQTGFSGGWWPGKITDFRVYNRALSAEEIQELYNWGEGDYARPLNDQNSSSAVSRWAFDGDATDSWGGNDGAVSGPSVVDGVRGEAFDFNNSGDEIVVPNKSTLYGNGTENFSVSAWVRPHSISNDASNDRNAVASLRRAGTDPRVGWSVGFGSKSQLNFLMEDSNNNQIRPAYSRSSDFDLSSWYHVVGVREGDTGKLYINGVEKASATTSGFGDISTSEELYIGQTNDTDSKYPDALNGSVDDVRIYSKALSPSEVFELYRWGTRGRDMRKLTVNSRGL